MKFTCGLLAVRSEESAVALINCIANEVNKADGEECLPVALECIKECKIENSYFHIDLARTFAHLWKFNRLRRGIAKLQMKLLLLFLLPCLKQTQL